MEESAPKRRRTSPQTSVPINPDATPQSPQPSRPRPSRPSFASPTVASLARHNPGILERRRSQSPTKTTSTQDAPRTSTVAESETDRTDLPTEESEAVTRSEEAGASADFRDLSASPPEREAAPSSSTSGGQVPGPLKPNPRPLPPPAPEEEDATNPFLGRALRRSPPVGAAEPAPPEPELPPSVPDVISSTPPRGIHSSPSRWREKHKPKKSSPLKQQSLRPPETLEPMSKSSFRSRIEASSRAQEVDTEAESIGPIRITQPYDPHAKQKQERDALRDEIDRLKKDLEVAQKENERIRLMQKSGRVLAPTNPEEVVELIRRQVTSSDTQNESPVSTQQLVKAVLHPAHLLPFGKPMPQASQPIGDLEKLPEIKSHHPIPLTADEELPYLQLFTPFTFTSNISMLPQEPNGPPRQLHSITLRSREVEGIFTARIEMTVNANDLTILDLKVPALEPAAKAELGPFAEKICNGNCNRSMQRNIGILSWALGEWLRVAMERAVFWFHLDEQLGSTESVLESTRQMRARKPRRRKGDGEESDDDILKRKSSFTRKDLIQFLGQQSLDVAIPNSDGGSSSVRLGWRINFDWTGEAQSKLAVITGVPGKWHKVDRRGALGRLPKLFEELVEGGESLEQAVKTIVALVTGEQAG